MTAAITLTRRRRRKNRKKNRKKRTRTRRTRTKRTKTRRRTSSCQILNWHTKYTLTDILHTLSLHIGLFYNFDFLFQGFLDFL